MNERNFDELIEVVPQTYGEAIHLYPWISKYPSHEWDNRTTVENATFVIRHILTTVNFSYAQKDGEGKCSYKRMIVGGIRREDSE